MAVWITKDEWYPVYQIGNEGFYKDVLIPDDALTPEEWADLREVERRFQEWQDRLSVLADDPHYTGPS